MLLGDTSLIGFEVGRGVEVEGQAEVDEDEEEEVEECWATPYTATAAP